MKKFRLPRKIKKSLKGKIWLYPQDKNGDSLMAFPEASKEDFLNFKQGIVKNILDSKRSKSEKRKMHEDLNRQVTISEKELKIYVNDIFRKDLRNYYYQILIEAKNDPRANKAYFNFVNAYQKVKSRDDSFGNICCLAVDKAKELLRKKKKSK